MTAHSLSEYHHPRPRGGNWKGKQDLGERATSVHSTDAAPHPSKQPQGPRKPPLASHGHLDIGAPVLCCPGLPATPWRALICTLGRPVAGSAEPTGLNQRSREPRTCLEQEGKLFCCFCSKGEAKGPPLTLISCATVSGQKSVRTPTSHHLLGNAPCLRTLWVTQTVLVAQSCPSL